MAKTISIDEIRQRKSRPETTDRSGKNGAPLSSPFSYIILLDENDPTSPPAPDKDISKHRHTND
jgi:hypothetical protein